MFFSWNLSSYSVGAFLAIALLASPSILPAQRGAGGGHTGGTSAGGGGLSGGGRATGVDAKDDLKDFRLALAVQASPQQVAAFKAMLKSTDSAGTESQSFEHELGQHIQPSEITAMSSALAQNIEKARSENQKFLDALSSTQKTGLKEVVKKLAKADAALAQETKALNLESAEAMSRNQLPAGAGEGLDRALKTFRGQQLALGQEMGIGDPEDGESSFDIQPVKTPISGAPHPITILTSGSITRVASSAPDNNFTIDLTADLSDLQLNMTDMLRAALDKSDPCGERIEIRAATLTPRVSAGLVGVQLHFERWSCRGSVTNEMLGGDGTMEVQLAPRIGEDGTLQLAPEIGRVDAHGLLSELLRSGSLGETLRDKITECLLSALGRDGNLKAVLPASAQGATTLRHAQFQGTGSGHLQLVLNGNIRLPEDKAAAFIAEIKGQSASQASSQKPAQDPIPR